jgi:hypothetical protein
VLVVRTGDGAQLRARINLEDMGTPILPNKRDDKILKGTQAVRVSLTTTVHSIARLQQREVSAPPNPAKSLLGMGRKVLVTV